MTRRQRKIALGVAAGVGVLAIGGLALAAQKPKPAPGKAIVLPEQSSATVPLRQGESVLVQVSTHIPEGYIDSEAYAGNLQLTLEKAGSNQFRVTVAGRGPAAGPQKSRVVVSVVHIETGTVVQVVGAFDVELTA